MKKKTERLMRISEVMYMTALARSTIWLFVKKGKLPPPFKLSPRVTVWKETEILQYLDSLSSEG